MIRAALVVFVAAVLAPTAHAQANDWSIRSPEKWNRIDATGAFDAEQLHGVAHRYASPHAPTDELAVVKLELQPNGTPRRMAEELLARVVLEPGERIEKRELSGPVAGDAVADLTIVAGDRVRRFRVLVSPNHRDHWLDVAFGRCVTSKANAPLCGDALASMKLESKAPTTIDPESTFLTPALWGLLVLVVLVWIGMAVRFFLRKRASERETPLTDGEIVTLTGRVRAGDSTLSAPLSGTACVMHRSRMYLLGAGDEKDAVTECARFFVETPSGDVLVDATPELALVPSPVVPRQEKRELAFMATRGVPEARHRDAGFDEIVIVPGATVVIRGVIRLERDHAASGERGYRDDAPTVTRLVGTETEPLAIKKAW